jgi:hypothetical protein
VNLVTVDQAKQHIRIDSDADDAWLSIFIPVVSGAVAAWLKDDWRLYEWQTDSNGDPILNSAGNPSIALDSNGDPIVSWTVKGATLVELAQQYRFRDGSDAAAVPSHAGYGYVLGAGATSLLSALRRSTVA